jgi:hypothetical protein
MGLQEADLDTRPPGGGWSVRQMVHHLADGDDIWKLCIKMVMGNEQAEFSLGWYGVQSQDTWAERWSYGQRSIGASLTFLKATREHVLQLLASVPDVWDRPVVVRTQKWEIEQVPVGFVIQMLADHLFHHLDRIQAIVHQDTARDIHRQRVSDGGHPDGTGRQ